MPHTVKGQGGPTEYLPKLLTVWREGYRLSDLRADALAGLTVAIVALPLSMAIAIACGVGPERGIFTAIVGGFLVSALGGSRYQIGGPAGAFIVLVAACVIETGLQGLILATFLSGFMLIAGGALRLGTYIRYIPYPVTVGFTAGIAVIIFASQLREMFGLTLPGAEPGEIVAKVRALWATRETVTWAAVAVAALTTAVILGLRRLRPHWPGMLIAVAVASTVAALLALPVETIGTRFGALPRVLPVPALPDLSLAAIQAALPWAASFALLGAIESLLSAVVADGMAGTRHDSNQELIGQGVANIVAPLFGGFAATGAIARTAANIRNGGNSPLAGIIHSLTLLAIILALAPLAAYIPLCALAAILFVVAYNMSEVHHFIHMARTSPRADVGVLLVTFTLTVFSDLVIAVNVGVVLASLLFMRRMAQAVQIENDNESFVAATADEDFDVPPGTLIYNVEGPFFFAAADKLERLLESIQSHVDTLVLRMRHVPFIDATGIQSLSEMIDDCQHFKTRLVICGLRENVRVKLARAGVLDKLQKDALHSSVTDFMRKERTATEAAQTD